MARCPDCIHFSLCDYNTNIAGDTKIKLYYDEGAEKCSFYKPTADVVEVKHGEWELKSEIHRFLEEVDEDFYVECPFCQRVYYVPFEFENEKMLKYAKENYPYCNCGAKMDKGNAQ